MFLFSHPPISLTDDEGLLGLSSVLVVPGGPAGRVDGPLGRAQEGRLGLALAGGPLPGREARADRLEEPVQGPVPAAARKKHDTCDRAGGNAPRKTAFCWPSPIKQTVRIKNYQDLMRG